MKVIWKRISSNDDIGVKTGEVVDQNTTNNNNRIQLASKCGRSLSEAK